MTRWIGRPRCAYFPATYDPFLDSGSTVIAAEQTERVCYGLDIAPKCVDVTVLRWQAQSGEQAKLEGDDRSFQEVAQERVAHDRVGAV